MKMQNPKYQQKSKCIPSPEQNYFLIFAMRYPVEREVIFEVARNVSLWVIFQWKSKQEQLVTHLDKFLDKRRIKLIFILCQDVGVGGRSRKWLFSLTFCSENGGWVVQKSLKTPLFIIKMAPNDDFIGMELFQEISRLTKALLILRYN